MVETVLSHERCSRKAAWDRARDTLAAVSYTHLDVYKRQLLGALLMLAVAGG